MRVSQLRIQQAGLLTSIPFVLAVGPVLGYYLGSAADSRWRIAPWGMIIGAVVGLASSAKVTADLIRQSQSLEQSERRQQRPKDANTP
jgi:F0F1-type ATP synthase assembly protein I